MKLLFTGDFCVTDSHDKQITISHDVMNLFHSSDFNTVNLECPVTKIAQSTKISKTGPNLNGRPDTFSILKSLNTNLVSLANNHIMDYDVEGLQNTIKACQQNGVLHVGAGMSNGEAYEPLRIKHNGLRITVLNFTENEWSIAKKNRPGANPIDLIDNVRQIRHEKGYCDALIVIIHGGHEYYSLPSPRMVKQYRFYAENGASLIVGHHPHCISGYEIHQSVPIFYSLGNFLFTRKNKPSAWHIGLLLKIVINDQKKLDCKPILVEQNKTDFTLSLIKGDRQIKLMEHLHELNAIISDENALYLAWENFIRDHEKYYLNLYSPINLFSSRYLKAVIRKLKMEKLFVRREHCKNILNAIRCEAHFDASKEVIEKYIRD